MNVKLVAIGLVLFTIFTLGVKVSRDHYAAKEARGRIESLQNDIEARDKTSALLRAHLDTQEKQARAASERIRQYEDHLRARADSCNLTRDDLRWLQPLRRQSTPAARQ